MNERQTQEPIVPISTILGLDYGTTSYDQRVKARYDYVKKQLELDPEYEGWDNLEYIFSDGSRLLSTDVLISTSGRVMFEGRITHPTGKRYAKFSFSQGRSKITVNVHRAIGCTFIITDIEVPIADLCINHKDLNKLNNHFNNLEWTTYSSNTRHGYDNDAYGTSPKSRHGLIYLLKWVLDDEYHGTEFILNGLDELTLYGIDRSSARNVMVGKAKLAYGCEWKLVESMDGYDRIPDFIKDKMMNDKSYIDHRVKPIKVTNPDTNEVYVLVGKKEVMNAGFSQGNVWLACNTLVNDKPRKYRGLLFEEVTRKEANKYPRGKP